MGIQDLGEQEALIARTELTIGDLKDMFGREATRRGLEYMRSLGKADRNFREAADETTMKDGYRSITEEAGESEQVEDASREWAQSMEKGGIGLDE